MGNYYETETEGRKWYITEWFRDSLNINKSDSRQTVRDKVKKFLETKNKSSLTREQQDLLNYMEFEENVPYMLNDMFRRLQLSEELEIKHDTKADLPPKPKDNWTKPKNKNYETHSEKVYGFRNGKKVLCTLERTLKNGKINVRLRDKKGRFVKFTNT